MAMKLLTRPEAAKFLRISEDKLRDLAAAGDVPGMKIELEYFEGGGGFQGGFLAYPADEMRDDRFRHWEGRTPGRAAADNVGGNGPSGVAAKVRVG